MSRLSGVQSTMHWIRKKLEIKKMSGSDESDLPIPEENDICISICRDRMCLSALSAA